MRLYLAQKRDKGVAIARLSSSDQVLLHQDGFPLSCTLLDAGDFKIVAGVPHYRNNFTGCLHMHFMEIHIYKTLLYYKRLFISIPVSQLVVLATACFSESSKRDTAP